MTTASELAARDRLNRLQKETFTRLEAEVKNLRRHETPKFRAYRRRYEREIRAFQRISNKAELLEEVAGSDLVYCGDFHTLRQAQRTVIKVLRPLVNRRHPIQLALEFVPPHKEKVANDFVRGRISEATFLAEIAYHHRWGFPWSHYRDLFLFARQNHIRVVGLNTEETEEFPLVERDQVAAERIVRATLEHPEALILCLYGDLHIASAHIPRLVKQRLKVQKESRKSITLFQNSDAIYWSLSAMGLEAEVDVVQVSDGKFCVLGVPPWIKWQSYRSWREDQSDLLNGVGEASEFLEPSPDYYHQVLDLALRISGFLKMKPKEIEQFGVCTAADTKIIEELDGYVETQKGPGPSPKELIQNEIVENGSRFFPERSMLYLSDLSENRAAEKAAQLVASKLFPGFSLFADAKDEREIFYRVVIWEAIGFFGSKIVNPKRKCNHYLDFEQVLSPPNQRRGAPVRKKGDRQLAAKVLIHRKFQVARGKGRKGIRHPRLSGWNSRLFFKVARALGHILADQLYAGMVGGHIRFEQARELYSALSPDADHAETTYWRISVWIERWDLEEKSKEDRF